MKVLFVSSGNSNYGIVPFIKSQGESLKEEVIDIQYFTIQGKGFRGYFRNIRPLKKHLCNENYDLIHAHYGLIGLLCLLTFSGRPIVLSIMGDDAYGKLGINGRREFSSYLVMLLTQIALVFVDSVIVKSKNILSWVPFKKKTSVVPNGVNFKVFSPYNNALKKNNILFLADESNERKNFKLLKEALEIIGCEELRLLTPFPIKHQEFPNYLNKSSVFVLTSFIEGSPNVIKEAMACNIPIVSTDVGDVKEVIGNTEGCYITSFDPKDVSEKILLALKYGKRTTGRKDIAHLESGNVARKIIEIYKKTIKK